MCCSTDWSASWSANSSVFVESNMFCNRYFGRWYRWQSITFCWWAGLNLAMFNRQTSWEKGMRGGRGWGGGGGVPKLSTEWSCMSETKICTTQCSLLRDDIATQNRSACFLLSAQGLRNYIVSWRTILQVLLLASRWPLSSKQALIMSSNTCSQIQDGCLILSTVRYCPPR